MKLLSRARPIDIKRAFVIADAVRRPKRGEKYLGRISRNEFLKRLAKAEARILTLSTNALDTYIAETSPRRLPSYNNSEWYVGEVNTNEIGVWRRAGGLPLAWTNGSLKETAIKVEHSLEKNPQKIPRRAGHSIGNIIATNVDDLQNGKSLLPIVFKGGTGTRGRRRLKRQMKFDIDDGCMRSIALVVNGARVIRAYIGFPKGTRRIH